MGPGRTVLDKLTTEPGYDICLGYVYYESLYTELVPQTPDKKASRKCKDANRNAVEALKPDREAELRLNDHLSNSPASILLAIQLAVLTTTCSLAHAAQHVM
jgi:hypothetical protein